MPAAVDALASGADSVVPDTGLSEKLDLGRPLRVKLGIDPSRPDLHLGHAVVLRKLRQFQEQGHVAVLIIGDFTGRVGDPSGQSETRPFLSEEEIEANSKTYLEQSGLVLDVSKAEVRRNSEWLASMDMAEMLRLASAYTVARMLERDDFQERYREGRPISVVEFLYPLMQAMDSVAVQADIELGGTDQRFNLLVGRDIQREFGQEPQVVMTMPLLEGTDGKRKMSKSFGNFIALTDQPDDMFGKIMRIPDELIAKYMNLCTDVAFERNSGLDAFQRKRLLGREVVDEFHGAGAGEKAEERFDVMHKDREIPEEVPEASLSDHVDTGMEEVFLPRLISDLGLAASGSEARRLIAQGGVRLDGDPVRSELMSRDSLAGRVIQVGRRKFIRLS